MNSAQRIVTYAHETDMSEGDAANVIKSPGDVGVTEALTEQSRGSNSQDQDWAEMIKSCFQSDGAQDTSGAMDYDIFNLGVLPSQFGATNESSENGATPATSSTSLSSSTSDINGTSQPYQVWNPPMPMQMMGLEQAPPPLQPFQLAPWMPEQHYEHTHIFEMPQHDSLGIYMPPTSHPVDASLPVHAGQAFVQQTPPVLPHGFRHAGSWEHGGREHPRDEVFGDDEDRDGAESSDPCYAQLLYQCLKDAPNHTLSLRDLYEWVARHSQKAKDPKNRGWQNSVRHNLSMNAAFARVQGNANSGHKKGSLWRLTDDALREGVISTTRYRKDPKRKPERRSTPALNRQTSGAKGGRATRDASRLRQQQQNRVTSGMPHANRFRRPDPSYHAMQYSPYSHSVETSPQPGVVPPTPAASPYFIDDAAGIRLPLSAPQTPPGQHPMSTTPPPGFQMNFDNMQAKPAPFANFEFLPLDYAQGGVFGNHDPEMHLHHRHPQTPTPSLMTEASFMTEDNSMPQPSMMMMPCDDILGNNAHGFH